MIHVSPRFVTDSEGRRTDVLISVDEFESLLAALEDREDAQIADEVAATEKDFVPFEDFHHTLKSGAPPKAKPADPRP